MTDNALTMALGAVAEVKPYGAVVVTVPGSVADARDLLPRVLDAMFAHGLVPCGDPAIESNGDGSVAIEVRHAGKVPGSRGKLPLVTREDVELHGWIVDVDAASGRARVTDAAGEFVVVRTYEAADRAARDDIAASFARTSDAEPLTETVIDDAGAEPTAKPKSGRWHK